MGGAAKLGLAGALALLLVPAAANAGHPSVRTAAEPVIAAAGADTVKARRHFFGAENVDSQGQRAARP